MNSNGIRRMSCQALQTLVPILLLAACSPLSAPQGVSPNIYMLEAGSTIHTAQDKRDLVLAISTPRALPGFDTAQMVYVQQPYELNYFATSRWADTPARMLEPIIAQAMLQTQSFSAVVQTSDAIPADVRLDVELVRLQQDFTTRPSRVRLTLRAQLIDLHDKRLLAVRQFDEYENATSENAYGGVTAANRLLQRVLVKLSGFCVNASSAGLQIHNEE